MVERLIDFLCMCSGARTDALARAPKGRAQAATLGLLMLLTAVIASLTSGYALHRAFLGDKYASAVALGGGAAWGSLVFCIDRLMILGLDKFATTRRLVAQVLMRVPLAVIIALVMSKPFILRLSETIIDADLRRQQRETIGMERAANAQDANLNALQSAVADLKAARQQQEEHLRQEPDSHRYSNATEELQRAETRYQRVLAANRQMIARANSQIEQIQAGSVEGQLGPEAATRVGLLRRQIEVWQQEVVREQVAVTAARAEKAEASREWVQAETDALTRVKGELEGAKADETRAASRVAVRNADAERAVTRIMAPDLVNQYRTLRRITADPKHPDSGAIRIFEFGLDCLFLILELTPVLLKALARKGPLDHATAAVEFLDRERINLNANTEVARLQRIAEAMLLVEERAVERWRDQHLNQLQAGTVSSGDLKQLRQELAEVAA